MNSSNLTGALAPIGVEVERTDSGTYLGISRDVFPCSPIMRRLKGNCPTCNEVIRAWVRHGETGMHNCDSCQAVVVPRWTHFIAGGKEFPWI